MAGTTSTLLCDALLGLCQPPAVNQYTFPLATDVPLNPKVWVSSGQTPFQVIHFSDVHIDRKYSVSPFVFVKSIVYQTYIKPGSEANCTKPICCRNYGDNSSSPTIPAGPNGESTCDSPVPLADSMLEFAQTIAGNTKFSIFTGDVVEG